MPATKDALRPRASWRFWLIGLAGLLWNSFGAYDYAMSHEPFSGRRLLAASSHE